MPNIIYEREVGRRKYVSIEKHRSVAHNRHSKWLSINIEKDLFDYADYGNYEKNVEKDNSAGFVLQEICGLYKMIKVV